MPSLAQANAPAAPPPAQLRGTTSARPVGTILGVPCAETTRNPINLVRGTATNASDIFVGQWDKALVRERGGVELAASDQVLFQNLQAAIRAIVPVGPWARRGSCEYWMQFPDASDVETQLKRAER